MEALVVFDEDDTAAGEELGEALDDVVVAVDNLADVLASEADDDDEGEFAASEIEDQDTDDDDED